MKKLILIYSVISLFLSCNNVKTQVTKKLNTKKEFIDTINIQNSYVDLIKIEKLKTEYSFKKALSSIKNVKHTEKKHKDMLTNSSYNFVSDIFGFSPREMSVKTTSYEYKKNLIFYVHTIKHINDTISIKPFLEKAQGKMTEGYLRLRVLIFAMKNDKEANFIDIPEKGNDYKVREEFLKVLYTKINSDVIICNRFKPCEYKDLRKKKPKINSVKQ